VVDEAVEERHRQWRVSEVAGPGVEVNVRHQGGRRVAIPRVDHFVEQAGGLRSFGAFDAFEAELIDEEQFGAGVASQDAGQAAIRQSGGEVFEQRSGSDVADAIAGTARSQAEGLPMRVNF
jgi:hypothetical protein